MNDLLALRDHLSGIRASATAAIEAVDRLIARVAAAEEKEPETPAPKKTPQTYGGGGK